MAGPSRATPGELALTGLRGLLALWVFAYHLRGTARDMLPDAPLELLERGYRAVDVFFLLSGFVLVLAYSGRIHSLGDYVAFLRNRIARIYPLHVAVLLALMVAVLVARSVGVDPGHPGYYRFDQSVVLNLLLLQGWGFERTLTWNGASWALSALFFAYLLFPACDAVARRLDRPLVLGIACFASLAAMVAFMQVLGFDQLERMTTRGVLLRVGGEFLAGCLLSRLWLVLADRDPLPAWAWTGIVVAALLLGMSAWGDPAIAFAGCFILFGLAGLDRGPLYAVLAHRYTVWLGTISLSIYLVHGPVIAAVRLLLPAEVRVHMGPVGAIGILGLTTIAMLFTAWVAYHLIESPARHWIRGPERPR